MTERRNQMLFNRPREIENLLLKENKRLKRENQQLHSHLDALERYKNDYKTLIDELHILKNKYQDKITLFDKLAVQYKNELNRFHKE